MLYKLIVLTAVLSIMLSSSAMASTVTLKGSCPTQTYIVNQTNSYIPFNITNLGNGTATDLLILPVLEGASTPNATLTIPVMAPGSAYSEKILTSNYTLPGSYAEYFIARYAQGSDTFVTIFPCMVNIGQKTNSLISVLNINSTSTRLNVSLANLATSPINATVAAEAPPTFTIASPIRMLTVGPYTHTALSFNVSSPKYANSAFPIAVSASYVQNGMHYATLAITTISFGASVSPTSSRSVSGFVIAVIVIIIVLLALIALSIIRKRRHKHAHHEHHQEERKQ